MLPLTQRLLSRRIAPPPRPFGASEGRFKIQTISSTAPRLTACLCAGLLLFGSLRARAQAVASCQTTQAPTLYPRMSDNTPGWSPLPGLTTYKRHLVLGDIDGDGYDELVTLPPANGSNGFSATQNTIQVSHWIQTGWTPLAPITNAMLLANFPSISTPMSSTDPNLVIYFGPKEVHLADVDGDGQKEVVVHVAYDYTKLSDGSFSTKDQEQVYHYDKSLGSWTFLTSYDATYGSAWWIKANKTDQQEIRVIPSNNWTTLDIEQFANGRWIAEPYGPEPYPANVDYGCVHSLSGPDRPCLAFADVTGDGLADLVYMAQDGTTHIVPSTPGKPFGGRDMTSKIPAVPLVTDPSRSNRQYPNDTTHAGWQVGDISGDGTGKLIFPTPDGALHAYYWDAKANDFAAAASGYLKGANADLGAVVSSYDILPKPVRMEIPGAGVSPASGLAVIAKDGAYVYPFLNVNGVLTLSDIGHYYKIAGNISSNAGFGPPHILDISVLAWKAILS